MSPAVSLAYDAEKSVEGAAPPTLAAIKEAMARAEAEARAKVNVDSRVEFETRARHAAEARAHNELEASKLAQLRAELDSETKWAKEYHDEAQELKAQLAQANQRAERAEKICVFVSERIKADVDSDLLTQFAVFAGNAEQIGRAHV